MSRADESDRRFSERTPNTESAGKTGAVHDAARRFADVLDGTVPQGRELSLALTAVEEALMWAVAGVERADCPVGPVLPAKPRTRFTNYPTCCPSCGLGPVVFVDLDDDGQGRRVAECGNCHLLVPGVTR